MHLWAEIANLTPQLEDVTNGLEYLHKTGIIHGDLKGVRWHFNTTIKVNYINLLA